MSLTGFLSIASARILTSRLFAGVSAMAGLSIKERLKQEAEMRRDYDREIAMEDAEIDAEIARREAEIQRDWRDTEIDEKARKDAEIRKEYEAEIAKTNSRRTKVKKGKTISKEDQYEDQYADSYEESSQEGVASPRSPRAVANAPVAAASPEPSKGTNAKEERVEPSEELVES